MLKIILLLFLWLLQVPPSGPWSPESWPMKAFYPRTIEKKTLIRHRKHKEPWTPAHARNLEHGEDSIWTVLTSHRCRSLTCLEMVSQRARTGPRLSITPSETRSPGPVQCLVQRRMFVKVYEMPFKFLLFFHSFISSFILFLSSFLLSHFFSQKGCCNWIHRSSSTNRWGFVLYCFVFVHFKDTKRKPTFLPLFFFFLTSTL